MYWYADILDSDIRVYIHGPSFDFLDTDIFAQILAVPPPTTSSAWLPASPLHSDNQGRVTEAVYSGTSLEFLPTLPVHSDNWDRVTYAVRSENLSEFLPPLVSLPRH